MERETGIKWLDGERCEVVTDNPATAERLERLRADFPEEIRQEDQPGGAVRYSFPARLIDQVRKIAVAGS